MTPFQHNQDSGINWELSLDKLLTRKEVRKLRAWTLKNRNKKTDKRVAWIDWFLTELGLNTGLRVFEIAELETRDIVIRDELSHVIVRKGKCGKYRTVRINREFQETVKIFVNWKHKVGESTDASAPLLYSPRSRSNYSTRGLQKAFKRCIKRAGIPLYHSIHHIRHTYASLLYVSSKNNLKLVQNHLGHSSIQTTQVYANLFQTEIQHAVEHLF